MTFEDYIKTEDALFHFTKKSIAIEQILHTKKFRLSFLHDTNDPREYAYRIFSSKGTFSAKDTPDLKKLSDEAHFEINRILRFECRIMSFCSNKKPTLILDNGTIVQDEYFYPIVWGKSRMWSQYGDNHEGVCLVISKTEIERLFKEKYNQVKKCEHSDIKYSSQSISYPTVDLSFSAGKYVKERAAKYVIDNFEAFLFCKHTDYRDESEFRVVVYDPDKKLEYLDIGTALKGLIVGDRVHVAYNYLINNICKKLNIECRQAHWCASEPLMLLTELKLQ
jgi:hypothetical protein